MKWSALSSPERLSVIFVLLVSWFVMVTEAGAQQSGDSETEVIIRSRSGIQLDVWIDGERKGPTPLITKCPPGKYLLTAYAWNAAPMVQNLEVLEIPSQTTTVGDRPLTEQDFESSFQLLVRARNEFPDNPHILVLCALTAQTSDDYLNLLGAIPEDLHDTPLLQVSNAAWAAVEGKPEAALRFLDEAALEDPRMAAVWRAHAEILLTLDRTDEARVSAERAVSLDASHPKSFLVRGRVHEALGDTRAAELDREHSQTLLSRWVTTSRKRLGQ